MKFTVLNEGLLAITSRQLLLFCGQLNGFSASYEMEQTEQLI
jgi:hypothetical protein